MRAARTITMSANRSSAPKRIGRKNETGVSIVPVLLLDLECYAFYRNHLHTSTDFTGHSILLDQLSAPFFAAHLHETAVLCRTNSLGYDSGLSDQSIHIGRLFFHV